MTEASVTFQFNTTEGDDRPWRYICDVCPMSWFGQPEMELAHAVFAAEMHMTDAHPGQRMILPGWVQSQLEEGD